jgi:SAM-dependent methyltransferase
MASRFFGGSKASKQKAKAESPTPERPSALPKRSAIPVAPTKTSKLPSQPASSLPKSKPSSSRPADKPSSKTTAFTRRPSLDTVRKPSLKDQARTAAVISRGVDAGMGTHTMISSTPATTSRNRLRRKASIADQRSRYTQSQTSESTYEPVSHHTASEATSAAGYTDPFPGSILGISMPEPKSVTVHEPQRLTTPTENATSSSRMASYALKQPHKISTSDLPPPTPNFAARSSASSSRYSDSPGPFSSTSTPTSASSQSPGMLQAPKFVQLRTRPSVSPTRSRPPVTRRKITGTHEEEQGLPGIRESQTSSSSSSTVKGVDIVEISSNRRVATRIQRDQPPPTAPLRLSSKRGRQPNPVASSSSSSSVESDVVSTQDLKSKPVQNSRLNRPPQPATSTSNQTTPSSTGIARPKPVPSRPSREDVPPLGSGSQAVIVKSNLAQLATAGHKRKESTGTNVLESPMGVEEKLATAPKLTRTPSISSTSKKTSGRVSATSPHLYQSDKKEIRPDSRNRNTVAAATPTSASPSKSSSRFGLFSRRLKSPSETSITSPAEKQEKLVKKGPVAGTGHEGYSRYARRGRSGSTSTAASRGRSTSNDRHSQNFAAPTSSRKSSFGSQLDRPELDDFYRDRLEPVVIGGGGQIRANRNSQSSLYQTESGQTSMASVDTSSHITSRSRVTLDTSAGPSSIASSRRVSRELLPAPVLTTAPSRLSERNSLAHRRSLHRSQLLGESGSTRIPPPINTKVLAPSPLIETYDSTISSAPRTDASEDVSEGHEGNWLKPKKKKQNRLTKKWNFFQRSKSPEKQELERWQSHDDDTVGDYAQSSVAHYAMIDDVGPEDDDEEDFEQRLRNIEGKLQLEETDPTNLRVSHDRQVSMLLPSPPKFPSGFVQQSKRPASPKVMLNQSPPKIGRHSEEITESLTQAPVRRPSRLQQVGRIPRVVSKRDRLHNPAPQSFSRPFKRPSIDESSGFKSATERPKLGLHTELSSETAWNPFAKQMSAPVNNMLHNIGDEQEFLQFAPRKNSGVSGSSSSGILSLVPVTAQPPTVHGALGEDEIWDEFDELLDDVGNGLPSLDSPEIESMIASFPSLTNLRSPPPVLQRESPVDSSGSSDTARASSPAANMSSGLQPPNVPLPEPPAAISNAEPSPVSLSEFYANYGDRSSAAPSATRHSVTSIESGSRYSSQTMVSRSGSTSSVESDQTKRVTQVMAEKTRSHNSHSLRFSALMTSRWLSFDRVLFSPAQEEVLTNKQNRVLVLDGLQNDDWSAYCALTYPDTMVYNLASFSKKRESVETTNSESWSPPNNLRRVSHASIAAPFPFPKGFFTAVVFRFPAASPSHAYRNAISECKRVLRPGGHLELTMLDMDMVNMGVLARRAVRGVKERIAQASPEVNLGPVSDTVMKLLGRRGFENLNRCVVGVPIAASVTASHQAGFDNQAEQTSTANVTTGGSSSLAKLLAGKGGPTAIIYAGPMMVPRVGRWWWSRCYERGVLGEGPDTIWKDKKLIEECEKKNTGLRLVVCQRLIVRLSPSRRVDFLLLFSQSAF